MGAFKDLTGQRFGKLVVIERAEDYVSPSGQPKIRWLCQCDCGNKTKVLRECLLSGTTKSCGCLRVECGKTINLKHGCTRKDNTDRLYGVWAGMKQRCYNPNHDFYHRYGARGIDVCDEWLNDYVAFKEWAYANGYDENAKLNQCTIDRIDSNKGYSPENCRWVNQKVQSNGLCTNHIIEYNGESYTMSQWANILDISYDALKRRIQRGWTIERAFNQPVRGRTS